MNENDTTRRAGLPPEPSQGEKAGRAERPSGATPSQAAGAIDVQAYIGRQLRAIYDDVAAQPVPDRFLDLINALAAKETTPEG